MSEKEFGRTKSRSGLRNRFRNGRSQYSLRNKGRNADRYGSYQAGKQIGPDIIAGHQMSLHKPRAIQPEGL